VLFMAYLCNPTWTSIPLQAHYAYRHLRQRVDLTLVTSAVNREGFLAHYDGKVPDDVAFVDVERLAGPAERLGGFIARGRPAWSLKKALGLPAYLDFERKVWKRYGPGIRSGAFDVVHRFEPMNPTIPSPLASWSPIPFVLGPLNGALPWPRGTGHIQRAEGEWLAPLRSLARYLPYWRGTYRHARAILIARPDMAGFLPAGTVEPQVVFDNGVDRSMFSPGERHESPTLRLLYVSRLVPFKQPQLLIRALANVKDCARLVSEGRLSLTIAGDGPLEGEMKSMVADLGLAGGVEFLGHVPHGPLADVYRNSDLMLLPTIHESGGAVLLEAMSCGLPCAVVRFGGPSVYVDEDVGYYMEIGPPESIVRQMTDLIEQLLASDRSELDEKRRKCIERSKEWDWATSAERFLEVYRRVLSTPRA